MALSLKQEIEAWVTALAAYDNNEFEESLRLFDPIADTSKILFNCGVIHATLGEHDKAVECYQRAIQLDQYLAIAYFQQGVSNFLVGDFEEALANFNDTLLYLRGNTYIDYEQLGLKFRLFSCEVLFNRGLCYIYLQQDQAGLQDFGYAVKEKVIPEHDVIDDAIREMAEGYTVFSIPVGMVYRPNEAKVKNLKTKDYLGKARLIASTDRNNTSTNFSGMDRKQALAAELAGKDDRLPENISFAATNLVQRNISSRRGTAREQSAPPAMNRNVFPPTPPPENDKPQSPNVMPQGMSSRSSATRHAPPRPLFQSRQESEIGQQDLRSAASSGVNGPSPSLPHARSGSLGDSSTNASITSTSTFNGPSFQKQRLGTTRTASESRVPGPRRGFSDRSVGPPSAQQGRPQLFRETTPQRFDTLPEIPADEEYPMQSPPRTQGRGNAGGWPQQHRPQVNFIPEEDEGSHIVSPPPPNSSNLQGYSAQPQQQILNYEIPLPSSRSQQSNAPSSSISKVRVKVHAHEDTRYIMIGASIQYDDFESKIREKFGIKKKLRVKMLDEGDMITMGDQDDLDMLIQNATEVAKRENLDMGKMEIWIQEIS